MTCFYPLDGWRSAVRSETGRRRIVFSIKDGLVDRPVSVPCGQCIGCRLERSRQWAVRCMHEASLHSDNCFLTLTFDDVHLPHDRSLDVGIFQRFMKRLRKRCGAGIRFYHCGEYGERYGRPHYHALIFNFDFHDKKIHSVRGGNSIYVSELLADLWPFGFAVIGDVSFQSSAYVARYIMKKITGDNAAEHYRLFCPETGEIFDRKPEYTTMSRRPGIGRLWLDQFGSEVLKHDSVIVNGVPARPPRFYDQVFEVEYPRDFALLKSRRAIEARKHASNCTDRRLRVREIVTTARVSNLIRPVDGVS